MIMHTFKTIGFLLLTAVLLLLPACDLLQRDTPQAKQSAEQTPEDSSQENQPLTQHEHQTQEPDSSYTEEATLLAVGDIMMHSPQVPAGYNPETKTYNYDPFFSEVKEILSGGDWVIGNLETPIAGADKGFKGYPRFNAPDALADALKAAGFNILTTANNHSMDQNEEGLLRTLDILDGRGILHTGTARTSEEAEELLIVTKNGISMAILNYTYGTNGLPVPEGKSYLVNLLDTEQMIADIKRAREAKADVVTLALHFGVEYEREPNDTQKNLVKKLIAAGADIILGSHPHVVQPYEVVEVTNEQGDSRSGFVIYSLGNFISNQGPAQGTAKYTDVGLILSLKIEKQFPEGLIQITHVDPIHTWVHKYYDPDIKRRNYRIIPIEATVTSGTDDALSTKEYTLLEQYLSDMDKHLQSLLFPETKPETSVTNSVYH